MGQDIGTSRFTEKDFQAFNERLAEETFLLENWFREGMLEAGRESGGFELEAWLVDRRMKPVPGNDDFLKLIDNPLVVPELAKFNLELNVPPQPLYGDALRRMQASLEEIWASCQQTAQKLEARLMMVGILPTLLEEELTLANMTERSRYRALNEQVLSQRKGLPLNLDISGRENLSTTHTDVMLEAATTSFQIHLQVDPGLAVRFYNASLIVSASMVAICANSPYLFGRNLWQETRIPLFEQAVAVSGQAPESLLDRVNFGQSYARESLLEFFVENRDLYPVLLPIRFNEPPDRLAHLRLHNGTIWRWNRPLIGFGPDGGPHVRIEHRVSPAGPTVIDSIANAAFFFGMVQALAVQDTSPESRLPFYKARDNFYRAARDGLQARADWWDGATVILKQLIREQLLPLAYQGLRHLELNGEDIGFFLGIIEGRLRTGRTGADWQQAYVAKHNCTMYELASAYWERQQSGRPVHEWSL